MIEVSIVAAFIAGLITFLAPCTLPLVPAYLGFISGVDQKDLADPAQHPGLRKKIILNGLFFVLGFSLVFIIFGTLAGILGRALVPYQQVFTQIGGAFVILFGLFMLGVFNLKFLQSEKRMRMPSWLTLGKPTSSFVVGGTFAFGWTPCVGPVLGSILLLTTTTGGATQGALMLAVFSLGLAIPFLLVAFLFSHATTLIKGMSKYLKWVSVIGGVFLIVIGYLLIINKFGLTIEYGFRFFEFIGLSNYEEAIMDFL